MFKKIYKKDKTIALWGAGYLSYTTMLQLQQEGFFIKLFDVEKSALEEIKKKKYPTRNQGQGWSRRGYLPELDFSRIKATSSEKHILSGTDMHIICMPENRQLKDSIRVAEKVANIFVKNKKTIDFEPAFIFETAHVPGYIKKYFVDHLKKHGQKADKDYFLGVLFRTDWSVEKFLAKDFKYISAAYSSASKKILATAYESMGVSPTLFNTIEEAEIYVNAYNSLQALTSDCMRQLMFAYPGYDICKISKDIFKTIEFSSCKLTLGTGGQKLTEGIDNIIKGSKYPERLTIFKEAQDTSLSSVLNYVDFISRKGYKNSGILGISYQGDQKDITLSPAITLAGALFSRGVSVQVYDPLLSKNEIRALNMEVSSATKISDIFKNEVVFIISDHSEFKELTQKKIDGLKIKTKLIIDNNGIWEDLDFPSSVKYCRIGRGNLDIEG